MLRPGRRVTPRNHVMLEFGLNSQSADSVVFAIGDVQRSVAHDYRVRPGQLAFQRIAVRPIATFTRANKGRDDSGLQVHLADDMIFTVGNKHDPAVGRDRKSLGTGQPSGPERTKLGGQSGTSIAGITARS